MKPLSVQTPIPRTLNSKDNSKDNKKEKQTPKSNELYVSSEFVSGKKIKHLSLRNQSLKVLLLELSTTLWGDLNLEMRKNKGTFFLLSKPNRML